LTAFWAPESEPGFLRILIESTNTHFPVPQTFRGPFFTVLTVVAAGSGIVVSVAANFVPWLRRRLTAVSLPLPNACLITLATPAVAFRSGLYPISERTTLFLLPLWIVVVVQLVRVLAASVRWGRRWQQPALLLIALLLAMGPVRMLRLPGSIKVQEDAAGATAYLQGKISPEDLLWIHGSAAETFSLYSEMRGWSPRDVRYSTTGWPCCPRDRAVARNASTTEAARRDFERLVPRGFQGRIWLLYTMRPEHWEWVGIDESAVVKTVLLERGCTLEAAPTFVNMGAVSALCLNGT
jgi:hypothetical protein